MEKNDNLKREIDKAVEHFADVVEISKIRILTLIAIALGMGVAKLILESEDKHE